MHTGKRKINYDGVEKSKQPQKKQQVEDAKKNPPTLRDRLFRPSPRQLAAEKKDPPNNLSNNPNLNAVIPLIGQLLVVVTNLQNFQANTTCEFMNEHLVNYYKGRELLIGNTKKRSEKHELLSLINVFMSNFDSYLNNSLLIGSQLPDTFIGHIKSMKGSLDKTSLPPLKKTKLLSKQHLDNFEILLNTLKTSSIEALKVVGITPNQAMEAAARKTREKIARAEDVTKALVKPKLNRPPQMLFNAAAAATPELSAEEIANSVVVKAGTALTESAAARTAAEAAIAKSAAAKAAAAAAIAEAEKAEREAAEAIAALSATAKGPNSP